MLKVGIMIINFKMIKKLNSFKKTVWFATNNKMQQKSINVRPVFSTEIKMFPRRCRRVFRDSDIQCTVYRKLCTINCALLNVHCELCTVQCVLPLCPSGQTQRDTHHLSVPKVWLCLTDVQVLTLFIKKKKIWHTEETKSFKVCG